MGQAAEAGAKPVLTAPLFQNVLGLADRVASFCFTEPASQVDPCIFFQKQILQTSQAQTLLKKNTSEGNN